MTHFSKLFNTVYQKELKIKKKREREMKKWNFQVSEFLTYEKNNIKVGIIRVFFLLET